MTTETRPLRVLALHGYLQTGTILRNRTGPLRRALKRKVEFVFLDGPFPARSDEEHLKRSDGRRVEGKGDEVVHGNGWWNYRRDPTPPGAPADAPATYTCVGWESSVELVRKALKEHAPIDGLVGFSQGSCLAALTLADDKLRKQGAPGALGPADLEGTGSALNFALLFASFLPSDRRQRSALLHCEGGTPSLCVPSMHVYGLADAITPPESAHALAENATDPVLYSHPGGHAVPGFKSGSGDKEAIGGFIDEMIRLRDAGWETWDGDSRAAGRGDEGALKAACRGDAGHAAAPLPSARPRAQARPPIDGGTSEFEVSERLSALSLETARAS